MKNLHILFIAITIILSALLAPVEPAKAIQPYVTTKCHYMFEGNEIGLYHSERSGDVSCDPFPPHAQVVQDLRNLGMLQNRDDPTDAGIDCEIIRYVFTEY